MFAFLFHNWMNELDIYQSELIGEHALAIGQKHGMSTYSMYVIYVAM
jgi:hypothetical protein